jgi:hypothetical protein
LRFALTFLALAASTAAAQRVPPGLDLDAPPRPPTPVVPRAQIVRTIVLRDISERESLLSTKRTPSGMESAGVIRDVSTTLTVGSAPLKRVTSVALRSPGADGVRLLLDNVNVPTGTVAYVKADTGEAHGPYPMMSGRELWTNTVFSDSVTLVLVGPDGGGLDEEGFVRIAALAHITLPKVEPSGTACLYPAACVDGPIGEMARSSTALMFIRDGSNVGLCSGSLLNDTDDRQFTPYLLTANHCVDTAAKASSVETFWDFAPASCGAPAPPLAASARVLGSAFLSGSSYDDHALLRLNSQPPVGREGRWYLGWDPSDISLLEGGVLNRISHPSGLTQMFSQHRIVRPAAACTGKPVGPYVYSTITTGGVVGGSSGGVAWTVFEGEAYAVGQLWGGCGSLLDDACATSAHMAVDGTLNSAYTSLKPWLNPATQSQCSPSSTNLCLMGNRFRVAVSWRDSQNRTGAGNVVPAGTADSGLFWFFDSINWEMLVKMVNGCGFNGRYWFFSAATTNVGYTITVTDTKTGQAKQYTNAVGVSAPAVTDAVAFPCP